MKEAENKKNTKKSKPPAQKKPRRKAPKQGQEKLLSVLKTVCVLCVVLLLLMVAAQRFGDVTFSSVSDRFNTLIAGAKSGSGYPYYFENLNAEKVLLMDSDLFVLTEDNSFVLDSTARTVGDTQHSFSSPCAVSAGGRTLLFDVGENGYRVQSKTKLLYEGEFPQKLLNGTISKNGTIALAARGESSQTKLSVLNKHQKEIFTWNCANENILTLALSDNGKFAAAAVVGAAEGELYSKVYMFDVGRQEPILSLEYAGTIDKLTFLSGSRLLIASNRVFQIYDGAEKVLDEDLSVNTLSCVYTDENKCTFASFSKYGSASTQILRAYDRKGTMLFETELQESVKGVSTDAQNFSVLTDTALYNYNTAGEQVGKMPVEDGCIAPFTDGRWTYVWTVGGINRYKTTEISENKTTAPAETEQATEDTPFEREQK